MRFVTFSQILDNKVDPDFGVSVVKGSSLTIPGQGCDLMQIIESIVKLPPLDERTFDVRQGEEPDIRSLSVKVDLDAMYTPEGVALAEEAQVRRKAKETANKAMSEKEQTTKESETPSE